MGEFEQSLMAAATLRRVQALEVDNHGQQVVINYLREYLKAILNEAEAIHSNGIIGLAESGLEFSEGN